MMLIDWLASISRLAVPLLFAALAGLMSERSGIAHIALEGALLVSAFFAAAATALTQNLEVGILAGICAAVVYSAAFAAVCIWGKADQIVAGMAFNLLAIGAIPVIGRAWFGVTGSTPSLPMELRLSSPYVFAALGVAACFALHFLFAQHRWGIRITAAGENPQALATQGVSFQWTRFVAVTAGGVFVGIGGIYLSLCQGSGYVREMAAGRGFLALAAMIFAGWRPLPTLLACGFFAAADSAQIQLQGQRWGQWTLPNQLVQILPFLATLAVLLFYRRRVRAPAAINSP